MESWIWAHSLQNVLYFFSLLRENFRWVCYWILPSFRELWQHEIGGLSNNKMKGEGEFLHSICDLSFFSRWKRVSLYLRLICEYVEICEYVMSNILIILFSIITRTKYLNVKWRDIAWKMKVHLWNFWKKRCALMCMLA